MPSLIDRLAVCSWSLQPRDPAQLLSHLRDIGISRLQIALEPIRKNPVAWNGLAQLCANADVTLVSGMMETVGEDYSTLESIRRTGGLVPDETWKDNWENAQSIANIAAGLQLKLVTFHAGFLPHEPGDPLLEKLLHRIRLVADLFAARGIDLAMETGQESAASLKAFLHAAGRANLGVNFDPANMILYDKGDPIEAVKLLGPWIKQCHIKDARKTRVPGTWGDEVATGTGEVDWPRFFEALRNFKGYFCIEREAGQERVRDIRAAREFIEREIR